MLGWWRDLGDDDVLVATGEPRVPLTIDARATAALGPSALVWAHALAVDLSREYVEHTIPQLRQTADFSLELLASAEANILTMPARPRDRRGDDAGAVGGHRLRP